jgi:MFS family permease
MTDDAVATQLPSPSDGRLITRDFVVVTCTALVFFVYVGMLIPIVPLFVEGPLEAGEFGIGLTIAAFAGAAIVARPAIGRLADRFGRRAVIVGGAVLAAVGGAMSGVVESFPVLLAMRGLTGIGEAAVFVGAATLIADMSPRDRRAESASYFSVAVFGGLGVGPIIGEAVLDDTHFARAFVVAGAFALASGIVGAFAPSRVVSPDAEAGPVEGSSVATLDGVSGDAAGVVADERRPFMHPAALRPGLVLACGVVGFATFSAFLPDYARNVGMSGAGVLFAFYAVVSLVVRIFGARLPETLGPRRAVTIALTNITLGLVVLAVFPSVWALWVSAGLLGLGVAFNYPSLMALTVNRASDRDRAAAVSSFTMFFEIGSVVGGLAIGAFAEVVGKQTAFFGAAAFVLAGMWMLRTQVVPADAPDAGPTARTRPRYVPAAGN